MQLSQKEKELLKKGKLPHGRISEHRSERSDAPEPSSHNQQQEREETPNPPDEPSNNNIAEPATTGNGGTGGTVPPNTGAGGDPHGSNSSSSSDSSFSSDDECNPKHPVQIARRERRKMEMFVRNIVQALRPPETVKKISIKAPEKFDGSWDKFRTWYNEINNYAHHNRHLIPDDHARITLYGSHTTGTALKWHQARIRVHLAQHLEDDWISYEAALTERFTDKQEADKNLTKLKALKYNGDIQTFLSEVEEINTVTGLTGVALRELLLGKIGPAILDATFMQHGCIPTGDVDLLAAIRIAGLYVEEKERAKKQFQGTTHSAPRNTENRTNTSFQNNRERKGAPKGKDSEKSSPGHKTERSGYKGKNPRKQEGKKDQGKEKKDFSSLERKWKGWAEAFKDVPQDKIDKYKNERKDCRRCGRGNHLAIHCYTLQGYHAAKGTGKAIR